MKIAPIFMPKQILVNKLNRRNSRIANKYVEIANDLPKQSYVFLNEFRLSLAKFARRNNCKLSFTNGANGTQMNVERKHMHWYNDNMSGLNVMTDSNPSSSFPVIYSVFEKEGEILIPYPNEPQKLISVIKNGAKEIITGIQDKRTMHFHSLAEVKNNAKVDILS